MEDFRFFRIISAEACPIFSAGCVMVDKFGSIICEIGSLLKPITAKCSGTLTPFFLAHWIALTPKISPGANIPSGGFFKFNN